MAQVHMIMIIIMMTIITTLTTIPRPCHGSSIPGVTINTPSSPFGGNTAFKITWSLSSTATVVSIDIDLIGPTSQVRLASQVVVYSGYNWQYTLSRVQMAYRNDIQALPAGSGYTLRITDNDHPTSYVESNSFTWNGPLTSPYVPPIDIKYRFSIRTTATSSYNLSQRQLLRSYIIQWLNIPSTWLGTVSYATTDYESFYYVEFDVYGPNNASAAVTTAQKAQETAAAWSVVTQVRDLTIRNTSLLSASLSWLDYSTIYVNEISWLRCEDSSGQVSLAESCSDEVLSDLSAGAIVGIIFGVLCCACIVLSLGRRSINSTTSRGKNMRVSPQRVYVASTPAAPAPVSASTTVNSTAKKPAKKVNAVVGGQVSAQVTGIVNNGTFQSPQQQQQQQPLVVVDGMTSSSIQSSQQQMMYESQQQQQLQQQQAPISPNPPPKVPLGDAPPSYDTALTTGLPVKDEFVPVDKSLV